LFIGEDKMLCNKFYVQGACERENVVGVAQQQLSEMTHKVAKGNELRRYQVCVIHATSHVHNVACC